MTTVGPSTIRGMSLNRLFLKSLKGNSPGGKESSSSLLLDEDDADEEDCDKAGESCGEARGVVGGVSLPASKSQNRARVR